MKISKNRFFSKGSELNIPEGQLQKLWESLEEGRESTGDTPFSRYLFYFGALIVITAMTWLVNVSWESFGGKGLFLIALAYIIFFTSMGSWLWNKAGLRTLAGLLITIAVCVVPLAVYGLQMHFGSLSETGYRFFYLQADAQWIYMELATIGAGLLALFFFPFPFLTAPITLAAWFFMMDIALLMFRIDTLSPYRNWMTLCFGLMLLVIGFICDKTHRREYGFWSYLFGTVAFTCGLNLLVWDKNELVLFSYFLISVAMMGAAVWLERNVLMVFGALGVVAYLGYLAYHFFADSVLFPFVLTLLGLGVIGLGVLWQKYLRKH